MGQDEIQRNPTKHKIAGDKRGNRSSARVKNFVDLHNTQKPSSLQDYRSFSARHTRALIQLVAGHRENG